MAISPTMKLQWSGKILSRTLVGTRRAEAVVDVVEDLFSASWRFWLGEPFLGGAHARFQNPGPTGSV